MVDFQNSKIVKLSKNDGAFDKEITPILANEEIIVASYKAMRDGAVFTNKRVFLINSQGISGSKKDITSLPYSKIQAFSVENAGIFDRDSELEMYFSGLGKVCLEFSGNTNITEICKIISIFTL